MIHILSFEMPTTYVLPYGTPLYWRDEMTGVLGVAVWAYISHSAEAQNHPVPTREQLMLLVAYLRYVINAPCWEDDTGELERLRTDIGTLTSVGDVQAWIMRCLQIGIDPL